MGLDFYFSLKGVVKQLDYIRDPGKQVTLPEIQGSHLSTPELLRSTGEGVKEKLRDECNGENGLVVFAVCDFVITVNLYTGSFFI